MNLGRIVTGGLLAGLVMNLVDFVANGLLLAARWTAETNALAPGLAERYATLSMAGWITFDFLLGLGTAWLYAAIRPRFGAGMGTAMTAGFYAWFLTHIAFACLWFSGFYTAGLVAASSVGGLLAALLGALVAGALYQEAPQPRVD